MADFQDFDRVLHKVVGNLADMDEAVLVDADVDESAESSNIGDDAGEFLADFEVTRFGDAFGKTERFKLLAGVAAGFGEFSQDVLKGGKADGGGDVFVKVDAGAERCVADEVGDRAVQVPGHLRNDRIALGMDRAGVEGVRGVADAEEASRLLEGFFAEARDVLELLAGLERAVEVADWMRFSAMVALRPET